MGRTTLVGLCLSAWMCSRLSLELCHLPHTHTPAAVGDTLGRVDRVPCHLTSADAAFRYRGSTRMLAVIVGAWVKQLKW